MTKYEATFIFDKKNKTLTKKITDLFKTSKIKVIKEDDWGVKSLAYPIAKLTEAKYLHFVIEADVKTFKNLNKKLRLEEELLRYLIVKVDS